MRSTVEDVMTRDVITVTDSTPFKEIVAKLTAYRVSALPVLDRERRVLGMVSEADVMLKEQGLPPQERRSFEGRRRRRERAKIRGRVAGSSCPLRP